MQEAGGELLTLRVLVPPDLPWRAMRIDLASVAPSADADEASGWDEPPVQALRADQLVQLAESLGTDGLLLRGDGSSLSRSGLRRVLRHLRSRYSGWIALQTRGPAPEDLQALLAEPLLDFVDLQLAWVETDADSRQRSLRLDPSCLQAQAILCQSNCRCAVRFTSPAEGETFRKVSAAFDAFVRCSAEPVAVQVLEPLVEPTDPAEVQDALEFVACRPAWMLGEAAGAWLGMHAPPRQENDSKVVNPQRAFRLGF